MSCPVMHGNGAAQNSSESEEEPFTYDTYLKIPELLSCQKLVSEKHGDPKHDEHLFIIIHQAYELWFKQVLHELNSVREFLKTPFVDETKTRLIVNRLERVVLIMKLLLDQFYILETMTSQDFLEFRKYLFGGSGFQSLQFRLLENTWGVNEEKRAQYNKENYRKSFTDPASVRKLDKSLEDPSMLQLVERWLERTPGLADRDFDFWEKYKQGVMKWLRDTNGSEQSEGYQKQVESFQEIFGEEAYNRGRRSLSHSAFQAALLISLYRDEPRFSQPFKLLTLLVDIDALITKWRFNHVMMVQRMIGSKAGTGGSSGYYYLKTTLSGENYRVFVDLFNLSTYLIPRAYVPKLTEGMKKRLALTCATAQDDYGQKLDDVATAISDVTIQGEQPKRALSPPTA